MSKSKRWIFLGVCGVVAGLSLADARGDVTVTGRYSETTAFAKGFGSPFFSEPDGPTVTRTLSATDLLPFTVSKSASSDTVLTTTTSSSASQDSSLTLAGLSLISAQASGDTFASASSSSGGEGLCDGLSEFDLDFTVSGTSAPYLLTGTMSTNLANSISVRLYNMATPATDIEFITDTDPMAASYTRTGLLAVGDYVLEMVDYTFVDVTSGTQNRSGFYTMNFATTPEPSMAVMGMVGALLMGLRRRRGNGRV